MAQPDEETKEIRLFGRKSIREEAYRQKILQLEKEVAGLEVFVKNPKGAEQKTEKPPQHLDGLYYESLISFDKKVKREQEFLEKRGSEITERLDLQAQRLLLNIESSFCQKTRWLVFFMFAAMSFLALLVFTAILLFKNTITDNYNTVSLSAQGRFPAPKVLQAREGYIRAALETQTRYRHQYTVTILSFLDGAYAAEIELNSPPHSRWFLKNLSSEVASTFAKYAAGVPAKLSFFYKGRLYAKAHLSESPSKSRFQYFY